MRNQFQENNKIKNYRKHVRRRKINLVFDEEKRREFLTGFHKRKIQRRKKAQQELQQQLKEEKKRIKKNARENYKKLISYRAVPKIEELLLKKEYEEDGQTVSILELKTSELDQQSSFIGENKAKYQNEVKEEKKDSKFDYNKDEVPGMVLKRKPMKKYKIHEKTSEIDNFESKKCIKKAIKQKAMKEVQRSKVFRQQQKLEQRKNKKISRKIQTHQTFKKKEKYGIKK